jgi:hypothetical protein
MVIAKMNRASPVTKMADVTVAGLASSGYFTSIDRNFFVATDAGSNPFKFLRLDHTATFAIGALSTLAGAAGDGPGYGVELNSATAATVAYVATTNRLVRIACATTPMTRLGGVDRPGGVALFGVIFDTTSVYCSSFAVERVSLRRRHGRVRRSRHRHVPRE